MIRTPNRQDSGDQSDPILRQVDLRDLSTARGPRVISLLSAAG